VQIDTRTYTGTHTTDTNLLTLNISRRITKDSSIEIKLLTAIADNGLW
jgi:hypothetical protein